ncbi:MAG: saccharopine dehydrogenase C-terminal domain-containing protein [Bacteroidota bacterium]|nr:saccharopine dehydrogenase C-terminal domain-containing protein [Bacteroidota bacterium]MEE2700453.1 saccharopine dehydrogenase C-terminal domain-containing protein [Bacteroidota bacterium]
MANIVVLGAGLVGSVMASDLSTQHQVTAVDISQKNLDKLNDIKTICADISDRKTLHQIIANTDLVVGAVPGFMGYKMMKDVIEAGKNIVDISFYPEDPFSLDELAKKKGVVAVMDCGVAPGMGNIILGHYNLNMKVIDYECLVGGLPERREWPYEYQSVFSPIDVIEEYVRPARFVKNSKMITKEALSDTEIIEFEEIGPLESWNSDGLRTLINTMPHIPNMIEKTLRYPGCVEYLKVLRESGFFSYDEIDVNGKKIRPIDVTSKLLFPKWAMKEGDKDFTVMRIIIKGTENGETTSYRYDLLDRYQDDTISMARTTGFTCTAVANLVLDGYYNRKGISPPEYLGEHFTFVKKYLEDRSVFYRVKKS